MTFALTETEEKEIKMQQKQAKRDKDVVEHIKLSVLLFLAATTKGKTGFELL